MLYSIPAQPEVLPASPIVIVKVGEPKNSSTDGGGGDVGQEGEGNGGGGGSQRSEGGGVDTAAIAAGVVVPMFFIIAAGYDCSIFALHRCTHAHEAGCIFPLAPMK